EREACPIVNPAEPRAKDSLVAGAKNLLEWAFGETRRIGDGNSGREIALLKIIESWTVIGRTSQGERNRQFRCIPQSLTHVSFIDPKLRSETKCRSRLQAISLPGRREE